METNPVFRRRQNHNNTPESVTLIITNYIVVVVSVELFASCTQINSFFWVVLGLLALYNVYTVRKYHEIYSKPLYIAYAISVVVLVILYFLLRSRAQNC